MSGTRIINIRIPEELFALLENLLTQEKRTSGFATLTRNDLVTKILDKYVSENLDKRE